MAHLRICINNRWLQGQVPETRLLWAILERALRDCQAADRNVRDEAWRFVRSGQYDEMPAPPFTFVWCCHYLDIEAEFVSRKILWAAANVKLYAGGQGRGGSFKVEGKKCNIL